MFLQRVAISAMVLAILPVVAKAQGGQLPPPLTALESAFMGIGRLSTGEYFPVGRISGVEIDAAFIREHGKDSVTKGARVTVTGGHTFSMGYRAMRPVFIDPDELPALAAAMQAMVEKGTALRGQKPPYETLYTYATRGGFGIGFEQNLYGEQFVRIIAGFDAPTVQNASVSELAKAKIAIDSCIALLRQR